VTGCQDSLTLWRLWSPDTDALRTIVYSGAGAHSVGYFDDRRWARERGAAQKR